MTDRLPFRWEVEPDHCRYEYRTTEGQRKCWDGDPDLTEDGWEEWAAWERFDYTEERYWRRPLSTKQLETAEVARFERERKQRITDAERAVVEAAVAEAENTRRNDGWTPLLAAVEALQKERE